MKLNEYLKNNPKEKIIFDFDDTLISLNLPWDIYNKILVTSLKDEFPFMKEANHLDDHDVFEYAKTYELYRKDIINKMLEIAVDFEFTYLKGYRVNEELVDFIKTENEKYKFYIWSSNTNLRIASILEELDLYKFFTFIICKDNVTQLKPDGNGFLNIYKQDDNKSSYLMVGNNLKDDKGAASNSGIDFFHITYFDDFKTE